MNAYPIKSASRDYRPEPFYLLQSNGAAQRLVAYFNSADAIRAVLCAFVGRGNGYLRVKLFDGKSEGDANEYEGTVSQTQLLGALDAFGDFIFHDGFHELLAMHPENGDYIAFDEHGLLFLYVTDPEVYQPLLEAQGAAYDPEGRFIYEFDHWHVRPGGAAGGMQELLRYLGLAS
ncbi:hypothetical protein [Flaviaesturariibacter aridisoli]|uniref:Uncharacterized protein n=1 Tax=Flaviaesturariibacter aridisoli TaxID=2545761 RepID=A0A4R4E211_9BACT|nr:hypothetical protein [Flaviaesturariibacter aridisoli]TCZ70191.1 hypothetical protein E0486_11585 [Flaviaesturariibacter aridisoli]